MTRPHITTSDQADALRREIEDVMASGKREANDGSSLCHLYDVLDKYEADQKPLTRRQKAKPLAAILNDFFHA